MVLSKSERRLLSEKKKKSFAPGEETPRSLISALASTPTPPAPPSTSVSEVAGQAGNTSSMTTPGIKETVLARIEESKGMLRMLHSQLLLAQAIRNCPEGELDSELVEDSPTDSPSHINAEIRRTEMAISRLEARARALDEGERAMSAEPPSASMTPDQSVSYSDIARELIELGEQIQSAAVGGVSPAVRVHHARRSLGALDSPVLGSPGRHGRMRHDSLLGPRGRTSSSFATMNSINSVSKDDSPEENQQVQEEEEEQEEEEQEGGKEDEVVMKREVLEDKQAEEVVAAGTEKVVVVKVAENQQVLYTALAFAIIFLVVFLLNMTLSALGIDIILPFSTSPVM
jgi:hypothetical protein